MCSMRCVQRLKGGANLVYWIQRRKNGNTWRSTQDDNRISYDPVWVYYSKLNTINVQRQCERATMNTWRSHIDFQFWNKSLHTMKAVEYSGKNIQQKTLKASLVPKLSAPSAHLISALLLLSLPVVNCSGWWGRCWFLPPKIFILSECHWSFGRSNHFRKAVFSCVVSLQGSSSKRMKVVGGGRMWDIISMPGEMISLIFLGSQ